jgi:thiol-disulfide isomerase/thioredoxin
VDVLERPVLGHAVALVLGGDLVEPALDRLRVLAEITPQAPSIAACALLAAMSCRHSALSNGIEALISRMIALGPSAKRPPHIRLEPGMPRLSLVSLTCALALLVAGCDRQSGEEAQPEAAAAGEQLDGKVDRSFAGEAMPAVELSDPAGGKLATADLKGKPVLVNLWATWCVPCVAEMPLLDALAGELGEGVRVVTVSQDMNGAAVVAPFFAEKRFANLPQWLDPEMKLPPALKAPGLPLSVLYDAEGKEVWAGDGRLRLVERRGARADRRGEQDVTSQLELDRRRMLGGVVLGLGGVLLAGCGGQAGAAGLACAATPTETRGPFPADGSAGRSANALGMDGVIRRDLRASFAGMAGRAEGVPLELELSVVGGGGNCSAATGACGVPVAERRGGVLLALRPADANYLRGPAAG